MENEFSDEIERVKSSVAGRRKEKEKKDPANGRCIGVSSMVNQIC